MDLEAYSILNGNSSPICTQVDFPSELPGLIGESPRVLHVGFHDDGTQTGIVEFVEVAWKSGGSS